ncbi:MAG: hypothetical protein CTY36_05870 [Methylocystis sp.]|nr:MAG: hypothetical protein CTY36_05870 [Methylocystis sp.]
MHARTRQLFAGAFAMTLISATAGSTFAQSPGHHPGPPGWYGRARPPAYAGDCKFPYPPGYRHDLKNWRTGQTDRDFSCYRLDND